MVICLQRGADLHMAQLMPLPLTVSCFSKIQMGFYLSGTVCVCVFILQVVWIPGVKNKKLKLNITGG